MRAHLIAITLFLLPFLAQSQEWIQIDSYPGLGRNHPVTFSIGYYGYVIEANVFLKVRKPTNHSLMVLIRRTPFPTLF